MTDNDNKAICAAPWAHLYLNPDGEMNPCCTASSVSFGNTNDMSLTDAWKSIEAIKFRKELLDGNMQDACKFCYMQEKHHGSSLRTSLNERYGDSITDNLAPDLEIKYLDIRSSNLCNMACVMCYHGLSSSWHEESVAMQSKSPDAKKFVQLDSNTKTEILEKISPDLDVVYFAGGEPLITPYHYIVLDFLIENDYAKNIKLEYNTNLTTLKYKNRSLYDLWSNFKHVEIRASIDSFGEIAEYQRYGAEWKTIENNWKQVLTYDNVTIRPQITITSLTVGRLPEFLDYLQNELGCKIDFHNGVNGLTFNLAMITDKFCIQHIPEKLKQQYIEKLNNYNKEHNPLTSPVIESCITFMQEAEADLNLWYYMIRFLDKLEVYRSNDWRKLWPEFIEYAEPEKK